ncbi:DUF2007 domain-containing protein [Rhodanobacter sp. L36]|uniref:putative signal transducing protein n=1 Tax=Rhodanobacter sp. L36 TaxID=1747221 RepID=UPI00131E0914|nr:DUF2007 domain-containing protein [Rhodanobacter sp. L36]
MRFGQMDGDELLRRYRSGDMTTVAMDVAAAELATRGLSTEMPSASPATEEVVSDNEATGDLVCLTRTNSPVHAELLCGLLGSEGIHAVAADANLVRVNSVWTQALGGIRVMVSESDVVQARGVLEAFRRGDYALSSDD